MKKPMFNFCLLVLLPVSVALTILIMFLSYMTIWKSCNTVSEEDKAVCDSDTLIKCMVLRSEETGEYYEVYTLRDSDGYIAFCMSEEQLDEIPYMEPSYYPVAYWHGSSRSMDLSQGYEAVWNSYYGSDADFQTSLTQVEVYDFSAYRGHTQPMGRGGGIALVFLWLAELCIGGILSLASLIGGIVIFVVNRNRRKALGNQVS